ncbi:MAG TPA: alpha/beta hydrolase, partial [Puia sp.]|nr:alpha/beta hydrolase [Puia sp.]
MAKPILGIVCFFIAGGVWAQAGMYRELVFPQVTVGRNGYYGPAVTGSHRDKAFLFDLYRPAEGGPRPAEESRKSEVRPLIIWMHGGGFRFGSKRALGIRSWCTDFARRGYVCAAINYRMNRKNTLFHFKNMVAGCYDAVEDARMAVAWFKRHAGELGIDTTRIVLAGNSAGGMIALQAAYSRPEDLRRLAGDTVAVGSREEVSQDAIAAVINFWGALFDTRWLANARVPIVGVHGSKDKIVIPGRRNLFAGSQAIHESADSLAIPNRVRIFEG